MKTLFVAAVSAAVGLGSASLPTAAARADAVTDTYSGARVTIYVPFGAGGNFSKNCLMLAPHLAAKLPGKPSVVVQHMPGAGGLKAANYTYNALAKNGLGITMPPDMLVVSQLLQPEGSKYESNKFIWVGRIVGTNTVLAVRRDAGVKSIADMKGKPINVASTGPSSQTFLIPAFVNGMLGTTLKIGKGYQGSSEMQLAMERGETTGIALAWMAWKEDKPQWFGKADSFAMPIIQSGLVREEGLSDIPLLSDLVTAEDDKQIARFLATASMIGRAFVLPPGVPQEIAEAMRAALWQAVTDPVFQAEAKSRNLPVDPMPGAEMQKTVDEVMKIPPAVIEKARRMIAG